MDMCSKALPHGQSASSDCPTFKRMENATWIFRPCEGIVDQEDGKVAQMLGELFAAHRVDIQTGKGRSGRLDRAR
jgi:hypothetical protein